VILVVAVDVELDVGLHVEDVGAALIDHGAADAGDVDVRVAAGGVDARAERQRDGRERGEGQVPGPGVEGAHVKTSTSS
jgi:hypothetical protein